MVFLITAVAVLAPLAMAPGISFYYDITPKVVTILVGASLLLPWHKRGIGAAGSLLSSRPGKRFLLLLLIALASLALSTAFSTHPGFSISGSSWRQFGLITQGAILAYSVMAAAALSVEPNGRRTLFRAVSLAGSVAALYGIAQYFGLDPLLSPSDYQVGEGERTIVRPPGTLGYSNYFANYLVFVGFFGLALANSDESRRWRLAGRAAAILAATAIALSGTRGALAGLIVGVGVLVLMWRPRIDRRVLGGVAVTALAVVIFCVSPAGERLRARVLWSLEEPLGGARFRLWADSLTMARQRLLYGWGPETFATEFPRFQSLALSQQFPDFYHESPHNMFLDALTAQGLPGLLVLALLSVAGLAWGYRPRWDRPTGALVAGLVAALVSHQFVVFIAPTALYFYLTIAVLASLEGVSTEPAAWRIPNVVFRAASVVLALVFTVFAARLVIGDLKLAQVRRQIDQGHIRSAVQSYEAARPWQSPGPGADTWFSRRLGEVAAQHEPLAERVFGFQRAFEVARRAPGSAENRANAWYSLAAFYAARDDFANTEKSLRAAIDAAPNWFKPHWTLAQALHLAGRVKEAGREAIKARELDGGKNQEVSQTLIEIQRIMKDDN